MAVSLSFYLDRCEDGPHIQFRTILWCGDVRLAYSFTSLFSILPYGSATVSDNLVRARNHCLNTYFPSELDKEIGDLVDLIASPCQMFIPTKGSDTCVQGLDGKFPD